jgi:hypothetical protein
VKSANNVYIFYKKTTEKFTLQTCVNLCKLSPKFTQACPPMVAVPAAAGAPSLTPQPAAALAVSGGGHATGSSHFSTSSRWLPSPQQPAAAPACRGRPRLQLPPPTAAPAAGGGICLCRCGRAAAPPPPPREGVPLTPWDSLGMNIHPIPPFLPARQDPECGTRRSSRIRIFWAAEQLKTVHTWSAIKTFVHSQTKGVHTLNNGSAHLGDRHKKCEHSLQKG